MKKYKALINNILNLIVNLLYNQKFSFKDDYNVLINGKRKGLKKTKSITIYYNKTTTWNSIKNWFRN